MSLGEGEAVPIHAWSNLGVLTPLAGYPLDTLLPWQLYVENLLSARGIVSRASIGRYRCGEKVFSSGEVVHWCIEVASEEYGLNLRMNFVSTGVGGSSDMFVIGSIRIS